MCVCKKAKLMASGCCSSTLQGRYRQHGDAHREMDRVAACVGVGEEEAEG